MTIRSRPVVCAVMLGCQAAHGGYIADRATLDTILGAAAVNEDFETYDVVDGGASFLPVGFLDSETVVHGQGPGLLQTGARYVSVDPAESAPAFGWQGDGYTGLSTKTIVATVGFAVPAGMTIEYDRPVFAFGLDLFDFENATHTTMVSVFAPGGALIESFDIFVDGPDGVFFGYEAAAIGAVSLTGNPAGWSTIIDNHAWAAPAPATLPLFAVAGFVATRRRRSRTVTVCDSTTSPT